MKLLFQYCTAFRLRWNGWWTTQYLRLLGCKVGRGLRCIRLPIFRDIPRGNLVVGEGVTLGRGVVFEITDTGRLTLGNHVTIGDHNRLSTTGEMTIGNATLTAENVSIRGSFHRVDRGEDIRLQGSVSAPVHIGRDVLIGAGVVVLQGSKVPDGVVIGALSLVKRHDKLHAHGIFAGSPLKHIRDRA